MKIQGKFVKAVAITAACLAFGSAQADTVKLNGGLFTAVDLNAPPAVVDRANAGAMDILWNGDSFLAMCVEITQTIKLNTLYTDYTAVSAADHGFSSAQIDRLDKLYTTYWGDGSFGGDAVASAAFQVAVWEITYDGNTTLSLNNDYFQFPSSSAHNPAVKSAANSLLAGLDGQAGSGWNFTVLESDKHQNLMVAAPVPEPGTWALLLAGLGMLGFISRRRLS